MGRGCFSYSGLEEFCAPPELRLIADTAFENCRYLRQVTLNKGLETLGRYDGMVFQNTGIEEITLPKTLKEVGSFAFVGARGLGAIYVEDGCEANISPL